MKNNDEEVNNIIFLIFFICFTFLAGFVFGIWEKSLPIDCKAHFHNDAFMETMKSMNGGDNYLPAQCTVYHKDEYYRCFYNNATQEQRDFTKTCGWMGPAYFAGGGHFSFYAIAIFLVVLLQIKILFPKFFKKIFGNVRDTNHV